MRTHASYLGLVGAILLVGCPSDPPPIIIDAGDAGEDAGPRDGGGRDTPDVPGAASCGTAGRLGGPCREPGNTCAAGSMCVQQVAPMTGAPTIRSIFGIGQGVPDPMHPGYYLEAAPPDPANDIPLNVFTNNTCSSVCDVAREFMETSTTGELDTCSDCGSCTTSASQLGLAPSWVYLPVAQRTFGTNTGFCRADCDFDPATNGGCPSGYTCSPGTLTCIEACTSDNECRLGLETTRAGDLVTVIDDSGGTCNPTTGRCSFPGTGSTTTGDPCEGSNECSTDVGLCLRGGMCGEFNCAFASDTNMDGTCDGGRGVCLPQSPNDASICIAGCRSAEDCEPGNACLPLRDSMGMPVSVGPMMFSGICLGLCDTVMSGADDEIINCRTGEQCDMPEPTADDMDPDGACRVPCTTDTECDTMREERCEMLPSPATYGFCRVPDQLCRATALDDDCYLDQACDLLAFEGDLGLCVDRCTATAGCTAPEECDVTRGVCRTPCTGTGSGVCAMGEVCRAGYCEQM